MRIKNPKELKDTLKPYLRKYLESIGTNFSHSNFQCPNRTFHSNSDATPSAGFVPDTNETVWNCFACGSKGDVFHAVALYENKPIHGDAFWSDNLIYLCKMFDVPVEFEELSPQEKKMERLKGALLVAAQFANKTFHLNSPEIEPIKNYVKSRKWESVIDKFSFGFCKFEKLIDFLRMKQGYTDQELRDAGLVNSGVLDGRLIFPIHNYNGDVIAFGSRQIPGISNPDSAKYIHFFTTEIYRKMDTLYNLHNVRGKEEIYVVEGNADVWAMTAFGIPNTVALMGVEFSESQYKLLCRAGAKKIILMLDSDEAGMNGLHKILNSTCRTQRGLEVMVKLLPTDEGIKDIDEFLFKKGVDEFKKIEAITEFQYRLEKCGQNVDDALLREEALNTVMLNESPIERERMAKRLAKVLKVREETIFKEIERLATEKGIPVLVDAVLVNQEKLKFQKVMDEFAQTLWARREMGLKTGFDSFDNVTGGILDSRYYIFGAETHMGKSASLASIAHGLLYTNNIYNANKQGMGPTPVSGTNPTQETTNIDPDKEQNKGVYVLYFSLDDNLQKMLPRFYALSSGVPGIPVRYFESPYMELKKDTRMTDVQKDTMAKIISDTVQDFKENFQDCLTIKDGTEVQTVNDVEKFVQIYKQIAGDRHLVVFVDKINNLRQTGTRDARIAMEDLSKDLKRIGDRHRVAILGAAETRRMQVPGTRPTISDLKETTGLENDADVVVLCYCEYIHKENTEMVFTRPDRMDENGQLQKFPIIEWNIAKNKVRGVHTRLFLEMYAGYAGTTRVVDLKWEQMQIYRDILMGRSRKGGQGHD